MKEGYVDKLCKLYGFVIELELELVRFEDSITIQPPMAALAVGAVLTKMRGLLEELDDNRILPAMRDAIRTLNKKLSKVPGAVRDDGPSIVRRPAFVERDVDDPDFGTVPHDAAMRWEAE